MNYRHVDQILILIFVQFTGVWEIALLRDIAHFWPVEKYVHFMFFPQVWFISILICFLRTTSIFSGKHLIPVKLLVCTGSLGVHFTGAK